jgi:hypothetical protein
MAAAPARRGSRFTAVQGTPPVKLIAAVAADRAPTIDAQSTDLLIVAKAQALGNDPVRIYNFVHDTIVTEIYAGSKKGAVGTLREAAGNDYDQASLLIALLRAAGVDARYQIGALALTNAQAATLTSTNAVEPAATLLSMAGVGQPRSGAEECAHANGRGSPRRGDLRLRGLPRHPDKHPTERGVLRRAPHVHPDLGGEM